uniref:Uncharacterized protein n=1 Tax=Panagrolaimus superbus TaxID=310955 RepID=A0A914YE49_9BILA
MLLCRGYIRHVLDGKQFDKKRYYFFDDSIIAYRKQIEQLHHRQSNNVVRAVTGSGTTEITYLGSPTYPHPLPTVSQQKQHSQTNFHCIPVSCGTLPEPQFISTQNSYLTGSRIPTRSAQSQPRLPSISSQHRSPFYPPPPTQASPRAPIMWPISPVLKRSCNSPQTNDYASMIHGEINSNYVSIPPLPSNNIIGNKLYSSTIPPPNNTPNSLSTNSSTALLNIAPKLQP